MPHRLTKPDVIVVPCCRRDNHTRSLFILVALAASLLGGCGDWPWRHDMSDQPSRSVAAVSRDPVAGTVPWTGELPIEGDQDLRNPIDSAAPTATGRALYDTYCQPCHGTTGLGDGPIARYFRPMRDLTGADVQQHDDGWFYAAIVNGTGQMPRFAAELTPYERWQIVHFLRRARADSASGGTR